MSDYTVVLTTVNNKDSAHNIAKTLVESKLCACVNILHNVDSVYRWEGKVVQDKEFLLLIKTRKALYGKLEAQLRAIHPYEVPEIVSLSIENGFSEYLNWLVENTN